MQRPLFTRRDWITQVGLGFGSWALLDLLSRDGRAAPLPANPLAPKWPHFPAKAKSVIFLMMAGGPSQMETFDPKPALNELAGQRMTPVRNRKFVLGSGRRKSESSVSSA